MDRIQKSCNLVEFTHSNRNIHVVSLGFSIYKITLSANKNSFTVFLSNLCAFCSFSRLIAWSCTDSRMLEKC